MISVLTDSVLTLINKKVIKNNYFHKKENGAVILDEEGRKVFLSAWQSKKQDTIKHPFLDEKIEWGMVPHVQAMLLARFLRGDLDEYPPGILCVLQIRTRTSKYLSHQSLL